MDLGINAVLLNPDIFGPEPEPVPCPYCGRMLRYEDYCDADGKHVLWSMLPGPCTCKGYMHELEMQAAERQRHERMEKKRRKHEMYDRMIDETLYGTGITSAHNRYTFERFFPRNDMQRAALEQVQNYVLNFDSKAESGTGLILSGPNGTGKTHLAVSCITAMQHVGRDGLLFRTAAGIQREIKSSWDRHISETAVMQAYTTLPLLVMDDIGKQTHTDYMQHCLYEIFDERYARRLPTVITTNLTPSSLASGISKDKELANALESRLMETMICIPVTGSDYRKHLHQSQRSAHCLAV